MSLATPARISDERDEREMKAILGRHGKYARGGNPERTYSFIRVLKRVTEKLEARVSERRDR